MRLFPRRALQDGQIGGARGAGRADVPVGRVPNDGPVDGAEGVLAGAEVASRTTQYGGVRLRQGAGGEALMTEDS